MATQLAPNRSEAPRLVEGEHGDIEFAVRHPLRILVAEDSYINRQLLLAMLHALGYEAIACQNEDELITAVLLGDFDLLLDDLDMSGLDGFERARMIRETGMPLHVVGMIAAQSDVSRELYLRAGLDGCLAKPVSLDDLKRVLREASRDHRHHLANGVAH